MPCGTEVLHVYATGLNGGLPHDMPADHCIAAFNLRGAYGPSMSQMFSTHGGQSLPEGMLPRAPLRSHAEYIEFCRCHLDEAGHRCWHDLLTALGVGAEDWIKVPGLRATEHSLVTDQRTLRITHVWEDKLCVWQPKLDTLLAVTAPLRPEGCVPALLIQVHEAGEAGWLNDDRHNYSHLLRVAVPSNPAFLVRASLRQLSAYTIDFVPPESLDEPASYLLSWAATIAPFTTLSADQLRKAATSDQGALDAAYTLLRHPPDSKFNAEVCRHTLIDNLCVAITTSRRHSKEA